MRSKKMIALLSIVVIGSIVLSACTSGAPVQPAQPVVETVVVKEVETVVVTEETIVEVTATPVPEAKKLRFVSGSGDVPTMDPALMSDTQSDRVIRQMFISLTHLRNSDAVAEPGMASWTVSDDGLVYTFNVRDDVPWVYYNVNSGSVEKVKDENGNDRMVNAFDFQYGILRTLDPATASDYAYVWAPVIAGGSAFNSGEVTDTSTVGVTAVDTNTLVITITQPAAFFTGQMALPNVAAQPRWQIESKGDRWVEGGNMHTYGPYTLKEWVHDQRYTILANPFWPGPLEGGTDLTAAKVPEIQGLLGIDTTAEFALYETGDVDWSGIPVQEKERVMADPDLSAQYNTYFSGATYYYGFNTTKPPFDDVHCRRALSYAIDRQSIIDNVLKGPQEPAQWFSRPGLTASPTPEEYPDLGIKFDVAKAKEEFEQCGYKDNWPATILAMNQVEGHIKIGEAIQAMWKDNLGVDIQIQPTEWRVYLQLLNEDPPQIWRLGWSLDYPDANNFLNEVFRSTSTNNHTLWVSEAFDKLVDDAAIETDTAKRTEMYAQAEELLVKEDAVMIPIYWYAGENVTKPYVAPVFRAGEPDLYMWDVNK